MKKIGIEQLLTWAFTEELCKLDATGRGVGGYGNHWGAAEVVSELGTLIDRGPNMYGVIPDIVMNGDPHPDAFIVGDAVRALDGSVGFEIAVGWNPFPEFSDDHGLIASEVENAAMIARLRPESLNGRYMVSLVTTAAILKRGPDWSADEPSVRMVERQGKPVWFVQAKGKDSFGRAYTFEADGYDPRRKRPVKGAYRKYELCEPLRSEALSRLDWQLWQDALCVLHTELDGRLSAFDLLAFAPDRQPWARKKAEIFS